MFRIFHRASIGLLSLLILPLFALVSSADFEQKMVSVNADNKNVTLTLFHFNSNTKKPSIVSVSQNIGSTISNQQGLAGISIATDAGISVKDGKIIFTENAQHLVKNNTAQNISDGNDFGKHTFLLSHGQGHYTLGYAPFMSKSQLIYALLEYQKSNKFKLRSAILLETGNTCSFYKDNGDYHAYYLKELNPAKQVLMVK